MAGQIKIIMHQSFTVVNIAILEVLQYYWKYFLGIASILPILLKFSIDSCIAIVFYSNYIAIQMAILFWKSTNFVLSINNSKSFYCED